jgi:hypothetical protein
MELVVLQHNNRFLHIAGKVNYMYGEFCTNWLFWNVNQGIIAICQLPCVPAIPLHLSAVHPDSTGGET